MLIKTFQASSMREALQRVRSELGPEATLLNTQEVAADSASPHRTKLVEVTASAEGTGPVRFAVTSSSTGRTRAAELTAADRAIHVHRVRQKLKASWASGSSLGLPTSVDRPLADPDFGSLTALHELASTLQQAGYDSCLAQELIGGLRSEMTARQLEDLYLVKIHAARQIEREIVIHGPIEVFPGRQRLVAIVGPTGAGKSVMTAKLAILFRSFPACHVGVISLVADEMGPAGPLYRMMDQHSLTYEVVRSAEETRNALHKLAERDLILLDTPGHGLHDLRQVELLRSVLAEADPDETHLVMSAATSASAMLGAIRHYTALGASAMIVSKLDEAAQLGPLLSVLRQVRLPLSYTADGQDLNHVLQVASGSRLAAAVVGLTGMGPHIG